MGTWDEYSKLLKAYEKEDLEFKVFQKNEDYTFDFNGLDLVGVKTIEHYFKDGELIHLVTKIESPNYSYIHIESGDNKNNSETIVDISIHKTTSGAEAIELYDNIKLSVASNQLTYSEEKTTETNKAITTKDGKNLNAKEIKEQYFNSNGKFAYLVIKHQGEDMDDMYINEYNGGRLNFVD
ncbi:hypothetical protein F8C76_10205 [Flagellimonas olearia]|uniref:Uncharacterized protein n=1 Tax=Flagellimonas olearia TaxID=552546 RepID=A0A6I1DW74_9FLAO|nr:hypothetical protein [Allomuricauda olearia]KAB7528234.1 hypothetical protein F8C76_10205 [Allomuricauda olearia]